MEMEIHTTELKRNTLCSPTRDCSSSLHLIVLEFGKVRLAGAEGFYYLTNHFLL